jgi:hypothetical protein
MIQFRLACAEGHQFDAWFRSGDAFDIQAEDGLLSCAVCGSDKVGKAMMAPAIGKPPADAQPIAVAAPASPEQRKRLELMRALRQKIVAEADYVGDRFADEARKIHFEEVDPRGIYGEATRDEVRALLEDGIGVMPLPSVPDEHN